MQHDEWQMVKWMLGGMAAILAITVGLFTLWSRGQTLEDRLATRNWFAKNWRRLDSTAWHYMPERVISWLVRAHRRSLSRVHRINIEPWGNAWQMIAFLGGLLFILAFAWSLWGWWAAGLTVVGLILAQALCILPVAAVVMMGAATVCSIWILAHIDLWPAVAIAWLFQPVLMITAGWLLVGFYMPLFLFLKLCGKEAPFFGEDVQFVGMAMGLSIPVTLTALQVGALAVPNDHVPQTVQVMSSNIVFDGVTLAATLALLSWAMAGKQWWRIPVAIAIDLVLAGSFACASLWFGLMGTQNSIPIEHTIDILFARSAGGNTIDIGPYFWTMHTVFLPTLLYLLLIGLLCLAKVLLVSVGWFLGRARVVENPLALTAALFGLLCTILLAGRYLCTVFEEATAPEQQRTGK